MGCGGSKPHIKYIHNGKTVYIYHKQYKTMEKWNMGVAGRMKFMIIKRRALKEIANIPKPVLNESNELKYDPKKILISDLEFENLQKENLETKKYYWYNHFDEVTLNNAQTGKKEKVLWRGQRLRAKHEDWGGLGTLKFADGSFYEGQIKNEKGQHLFHGRGKRTHVDGSCYWGDWKDGKADGKGIMIKNIGLNRTGGFNYSSYDGEWKNDVRHGFGKETWDNGKSSYEGTFENNEKTGQGEFKTTEAEYHGSFKANVFDGEGTYHDKENGKRLIGTFKNNQFVKGTMEMNDGSQYEGQFKNHMKHGRGVVYTKNENQNTIYAGTWENDLKNGQGNYFNLDNMTKTQQQWVRGKKTGASVTTQTTQAEIDQIIKNPGYNYSGKQTLQSNKKMANLASQLENKKPLNHQLPPQSALIQSQMRQQSAIKSRLGASRISPSRMNY